MMPARLPATSVMISEFVRSSMTDLAVRRQERRHLRAARSVAVA